MADPNRRGSDGLFATPERARDAVRELKKVKSTDIVVYLREGLYTLSETVVLQFAASPQEKHESRTK